MKKKIKLEEILTFMSGSPQFRIQENNIEKAPVYICYNQIDLMDDLYQTISEGNKKREVCTFDELNLLQEGDVVFSLISGMTSMVQKEHEGYLFTQNYIKLIPKKTMDKKFLVYLLNESSMIRKQFQENLQGSFVLKYTIRQLKNLQLSKLPDLTIQKRIGDIYFKQLKKEGLKRRVAELETKLVLEYIKEAMKG